MQHPSPPARDSIHQAFGIVRVEACVDRALEDVSRQVDLGGRVEIGAMPELCCDGAALSAAMGLALIEALSDPAARVSIAWEMSSSDQVLVIKGPMDRNTVLTKIDALLAAAGGRAWMQQNSNATDPLLYLCPGLGTPVSG